MIELYESSISPAAQKVRMVLHEKGLTWKSHLLDLQAGDQFSPEYRKINPNSVIPTLVHDGSIIAESSIIIDYLDDTFPDPPLKPLSSLSRARMKKWMLRLDVEAHDALGILNFATARRHQLMAKMAADELERYIESISQSYKRYWQRETIYQGIDAPIVKDAIRCWDTLLEELELALAEEQWLVGENISLADISITPYVTRLSWLGMSGLWEQHRPHIGAWFTRMRSRPAYARAITDFADKESIELLQKYGKEAWPIVRATLNEA